jgi:lipid A 3-O-deacylase
MKIIAVILMLIFSIIPRMGAAQSEQEESFDTFSIYMENDLLAGTDQGYTGGLKMSWSTPFKSKRTDYHLPKWTYPMISRFPFLMDPDKKSAVSFSIGTLVYTPEDTETKELVRDDRPYAGISYFAAGIHSKTDDQKYSLELALGIIGPHSYAGDLQNGIHRVTGSDRAEGWDNQIEDEFLMELIGETRWRWADGDLNHNLSYDIIPHLGGRIGNVAVYANTGAELRLGWNLPMNFGTCPIRAGCETSSAFGSLDMRRPGPSEPGRQGIHLFMSCDGRVMLHDITLDGNTFRDSHSVDKEILVADIMAGIAYARANFKCTYSYVYRTKQFKKQDYDSIFGALSFIFFF